MPWSPDPLPLPRIQIPGWGGDDEPAAVDDGLPGWFAPWVTIAADIGIGADKAVLNALRIAIRDGALGADAASVRPRALVSDTGVGADRAGVRPRAAAVDTGRGADAGRFGAHASDTGVGADSALWRPRFAAVDRAVGVDVATVRFRCGAADAGVGADTATAGFAAHEPELVSFAAPGTHTYTIPVWCTHIELVGIGGGEGGDSGSGALVAGAGGAPGVWNAATIQRGVHIPWSATTLAVVVGDGGAGGAAGVVNTDGAGGASTIWTYGGATLLTCPGGDDGGIGQDGKAAGNYTYNSVPYAGGAAQTSGNGSPGNPPGGGGRGGNGGFGVGSAGGKGAAGAGYARARQ